MLRINPIKKADSAKRYYAAEDYYAKGVSAMGSWFGKGAALLGLSGTALREHFDALCDNIHPILGGHVTGDGRKNKLRRIAFDLTFSAFKSASVLFALFGDERILHAFDAAVLHTMSLVEEWMTARVPNGKSTYDRKTGNMVAVPITHFLSRPVDGWSDMFLHSHVVGFNMTYDAPDDKWRAGNFRPIKERADYFEEIFESDLAQRLEAIGYPVERRTVGKKTKFELKDVPESVVQIFSRRTKETEEEIKIRNLTDPEACSGIGREIRNQKGGLQGEELKQRWREVVAVEYHQLERLYFRSLQGPQASSPTVQFGAPQAVAPVRRHKTAKEMVEYAVLHCFERASVCPEHRFLIVALQQGTGGVSLEELQQAIEELGLIRQETKKGILLTSPQVLREEWELINFVKATRGTLPPLQIIDEGYEHDLSGEQWNALKHVLMSSDRITAVSGSPGSGKTTVMRPTISRIEEAGFKVLTFAPSAKASRGVLRNEGFQNADTFQRFLIDPKLQERASGQVVWIDEAGLLSVGDMLQLFRLAARKDFRVVLSGDTGQHSPVARGDAMRLLENHAGLQPARVKTVRRQNEEGYRRAVQLFADGELEKSYRLLDDLGFIQETDDKTTRHDAVANEYVRLRQEHKSCLLVSPTHKEGGEITDQIRAKLKLAGELHGQKKKQVFQLNALDCFSLEAQRSVASAYREGLVIQFQKDLPGKKFRRGDRATVTSIDNGVVMVSLHGTEFQLPLDCTKLFSVCEPSCLEICPGERIKITQNGKTVDGKAVNNGDVFTVKRVNGNGELILADGRSDLILPADYGNITYGYYSTSYASQGDTVDHVLLAQSEQSRGKAASAEQFNVSISRGRHRLTIFTDDKEELLEAVLQTSARESAHDILSLKRRQRLLDLVQHPPKSGPAIDTVVSPSVELSQPSTTELEIEL